MNTQNKEALIAEIERFKAEALKMHIVQVLADTYTNTDLFDYNLDSDGSVIWYKAQARQLWEFWQSKPQVTPELIAVGNELQSWVAVWSFKARNDREDYIVVDANLLAEKIEKLTGANA